MRQFLRGGCNSAQVPRKSRAAARWWTLLKPQCAFPQRIASLRSFIEKSGGNGLHAVFTGAEDGVRSSDPAGHYVMRNAEGEFPQPSETVVAGERLVDDRGAGVAIHLFERS